MAAHPHQTRSRRSARLLTGDDNSLSFDVIQSGPTRTTATLTPTTLRNIEQTFLEVPEATSGQQQIPHQAGFVPPFIPFQPIVQQQQPQQQQHQQLPAQSQLMSVIQMENVHNTNSSHSFGNDDQDDEDEEEMAYTANQAVNRSLAAVMDDDSMGSDSYSNASWPSEKTGTSTPPPVLNNSGEGTSAVKTPARRGGRRPNKASNLSPEEQEKRCLRRERNKLAAARCRKRRVDHTNELTGEVDGLEKKKQMLQNDIKNLQLKKEELEFLLEAHRDHCRLFGRSSSPPDVKPQLQQQMLALAEKIKSEPMDHYDAPTPPAAINTDSSSCSSVGGGANGGMMIGGANSGDNLLLNNNPLMSSASKGTSAPRPVGLMMKPNRPSSLAVPFTLTPSQTLAGVRSSDFSGIPISTPSTGIFNFDSLMDGGTGLTPVAGPLVPTSTGSMATHQRNPMELVTPTSEPSKLVSL